MRIFTQVFVLLMILSLTAFSQNALSVEKGAIDNGDRVVSKSQQTSTESVQSNAVFIGKSWNVYSSQHPYTNQIGYDPYTGLIGIVKRGDRSRPWGSGQIIYQVSKDGGANWSPQIGPLNPTIPGYNAMQGRHPNLILVNPTKSTTDTNAVAFVATSNNLVGGAWRDVIYMKETGFNGVADAFDVDSVNKAFSFAGAIDLNNGVAYYYLRGCVSDNFWVSKSTDAGETWTTVKVFNNSEDTIRANGGWLDVDNTGNVHWLCHGKFNASITPGGDSVSNFFVYRKSTDQGATWSTPEFKKAADFGKHDINDQFDCIVDANGTFHIAALLVDTAITPNKVSLHDITRTSGGEWSSVKIADIKKSRFDFLRDLNTLNEPHYAKSVDGSVLSLSWIDQKSTWVSPDPDSLADIYMVGKTASGASWSAPVNISNTVGVQEKFTKASRFLKTDNKMMLTFYEFGANDDPWNEASLYFIENQVPVSVNELDKNIPSKYVLEQNFPNPFNPATTITYEIPINEYVTLSVYNALGQEVAKLVNERKAAGRYEVRWNASDMSSGVYFYRLTAGKFANTKKLLLVK